MKASFFVIITLVVVLACNSKQDPPKNVEDEEEYVANNGLALDSAQKFVWKYDSIAFAFFDSPVPIRAYTVQAEDLLEAIGASRKTSRHFDYVRIYIGMDKKKRFRAFLTPVVGADIKKQVAGRDSILSGKYRDGWVRTDEKIYEGPYVVDFTMPCPNSCDKSSKIFDSTFMVQQH